MINCPRCGREAEPHKSNPRLCVECVKAENNRVARLRKNPNWIAEAEAACLELWERQPAETDREWQIWLTYRDMYPSTKPSYRAVADQLNTSVEAVRKASSRWHFPTRMQAWAKYVDTLIINKRRQEILDMNDQHVRLATLLNEKLEMAIKCLDPTDMKPNEITSMIKMVADLERRARLTEVELIKPDIGEDNPALKKSITKIDDMAEIVAVLQQSGALEAAGAVGVKKTVTTEVVMRND